MPTDNPSIRFVKRRSRRVLFRNVLLVGFIIVITMLFVLHLGGRWTPGESAWPRLPAATRWAVDIHGSDEIVAALKADGVVSRILSRLSAGGPFAASPVSHDAGSFRIHPDALRVAAICSWLPGPVRRLVMPQSAVIGMVATPNGDELFCLAKPPAWLSWFAPKDGETHPVEDGDGNRLYYQFADSWCVLSPAADAVAAIVSAPPNAGGLSTGLAGTTDPYVFFAQKTEMEANPLATAPLPAAPVPASPFFSGPPAPVANDVPEPPADSRAKIWSVSLRPRSGAWEARGEWQSGNRDLAAFVREADAPLDAARGAEPAECLRFTVATPPPRGGDQGAWLEELVASPPDPKRDHPLSALLWLWMRWGWLHHADNRFVVFGIDPPPASATEKFALPKAPVVGVAWETKGDHQKARDDFHRSIRQLTEAAEAPGGPPWAEAFRRGVSVHPLATVQGTGGRVAISSGLVFGLEPSWFMSGESQNDVNYGVVASHPSGLSWLDNRRRTLFAPGGTAPTDVFSLAGSWNISAPFRKNSLSVLSDISDGVQLTAGVAPPPQALTILDMYLELYPSGTIAAEYDPAQSRLRFTSTILRPR